MFECGRISYTRLRYPIKDWKIGTNEKSGRGGFFLFLCNNFIEIYSVVRV